MQPKFKELLEKYANEPDGADRAEKETADFMATVDALHGPDMVVGGDRVTGVGGRSENRSIGAQWPKKAPRDTKTRAEHLEQVAKDAKNEGRKTMNVKLKRC